MFEDENRNDVNGYTPNDANGYTPSDVNGYTPNDANGYTPNDANGYTPSDANGYKSNEDANVTYSFSGDSNQAQGLYEKTEEEKPKKEKKHTGRKVVGFCASAVAFGLIASVSFIGFNEAYNVIRPKTTAEQDGSSVSTAESTSTPKIASTAVLSSGVTESATDLSSVVEGAMPSLVSISGTYKTTTNWFGYLYENTTEGAGSGIIIGENDEELFIATNNHVVQDGDVLKATFIDGTSAEITIKGTDPSNDLAVVSVKLSDLSEETRNAIKVATLHTEDDTKIGEMVIAIGNALGYGQSTTVGYLSAKDRQITVSDSSTGEAITLTVLQVDAAINPGNSGGALLNAKGEVIGINSAKLQDTQVEGMGYAIPISYAYDILEELMTRETLTDDEKGYLGIYMSSTEITPEISELYGWPEGVFVKEVVEGGAAEAAGIKANDIITAVDGYTITSNSGLQSKVNSYRAGSVITVTVKRYEDGEWKSKDIEVTLGGKAVFDSASATEKTEDGKKDSKESEETPSIENNSGDDRQKRQENGSDGNYYYSYPNEDGSEMNPFDYFMFP
jgi:serine protease Do